MDFARRPHPLAELEPDDCTDPQGIPRRSLQAHAQAGARADIFVQAAHERNEPPADLVERVRKANLLENVMCGVSLYAILKALDERWEPWDETLASVQCPPQAVDSFAEASIDAAMAAAAEDTSEG